MREGREAVLKQVGQRIVHLREIRGWSRKELARELKVTWDRLGRWERGERQPPLSILFLMNTVLGVAIYEIGLSEPMTAPEVAKGESV
jgi:ribosome-binding protein aMBF1 (putative translation factor)